jgi:hypothetical protein
MTWEQAAILAVLAGALAAFVWDRWRYDVVAITSLMVCVLLGLIGPEAAFAGFSNPAVITVGAVLVISRALTRSGAIDALMGRLVGASTARFSHLVTFCVLGALAVRVHEQRRRARPADACGFVHGAPSWLFARASADAAVIRDPAWRHDDPDRHAAEPSDLGLSGRSDRAALSPVRLRADRARAQRRRRRLSSVGRPAASARSPSTTLAGGRVRDSGLRHGGAHRGFVTGHRA